MLPDSDTLVFTLCSNNYLGYAKVLAESMKRFEPGKTFVIGLVDRRRDDIPYAELGCPVIEIAGVVEDITHYAAKFSIVELNTFAKPAFFQYFFRHYPIEKIIFLDPDTCLYDRLDLVCSRLDDSEFVLTPHVVTPIPLDGETPEESLFLNYGIFNFGFLAIKKTAQTLSFLEWWRIRTYERGFDRPASGLFTDQIWGNLIPVYFQNVHILLDRGHNMALWNLHERSLSPAGDGYLVNDSDTLVFFHFSGVRGNPTRILRDYSRFQGTERGDLEAIYAGYRSALQDSPFYPFFTTACFYSRFSPPDKSGLAVNRPNRTLRQRVLHRLVTIIKNSRRLTSEVSVAAKS